jgi:hypothetical protein
LYVRLGLNNHDTCHVTSLYYLHLITNPLYDTLIQG